MRYIVAGMFEQAKSYWTAAIWAKVLVAIAGFVLSFQPGAARIVGICVLALETVAFLGFSKADDLKSAAEPMLTRLDFEHGLGWKITKEQVDEYRADHGKYESRGRAVRMDEPYFASGDHQPGAEALRQGMMESAFFTRAISRNAMSVVYSIVALIALAFFTVLITGLYRQLSRGENAVDEFAVSGLIFLVTIDLVPLARQYGALAAAATRARDVLSGARSESTIISAVIEYQLARASAPLLPTFAFLKGRMPLSAIWSGDNRK